MDIPVGTLEAVLREDGIELPPGETSERKIKCFNPNHDDKNPSMYVNVSKGTYFCHGCPTKGDAVDYLSDFRGMSKRDVMQYLRGKNWPDAKITHAWAEKEKRDGAKKNLPRHSQDTWPSHKGRPAIATHDYQAADGTLICRLIRYANKPGAKLPKVFPFTPCSTGGWWNADPTSDQIPEVDRRAKIKPLYRLPELLAKLKQNPDTQIWVVEGEKCVDTMLAARPDGNTTPCTTAMFAKVEQLGDTDFTPLAGKRILLLADQDDEGHAKMLKFASHLVGQLGCAVRVFLPPGKGEAREKGHDVADAIHEGGWQGMLDWIAECGGPQPYVLPERPAEELAYIPPMVENEHFKILGFVGAEHVAIQRKTTHEIHVLKRTSLNGETTLLVLAPLAWWIEMSGQNSFGPVTRRSFADSLLRGAETKGHIDMSNLLGRGAAKRGNIYSYNVGDSILQAGEDGQLTVGVSLANAGGMYQPAAPVQLKDDERAGEYAKELYEAVMQYRWLADVDGRAFLGWVVSSLIGGALRFRPMLWLLAPASSGKSFLLTDVLTPVLGDTLKPLADATAAGMTMALRNDSLPCYLDEFEPRRGQESKWEDVLAVARIATSGVGARIRGSAANDSATMYQPRFSLLVASVQRPALTTADESRFFTLRLSPRPVADWPKVRAGIWAATNPEKMLALRTHVIRNTARISERAIQIEDELQNNPLGMDTRAMQAVAVLTAGVGFFSGDYTYVKRRDGVKDDTYAMFSTMLSTPIQVGVGERLSIAETLRKGWWDDMGMFNPEGAEKSYCAAAARYGFMMATESTMYIGTGLNAQRELLRNTGYAHVDSQDYFRRLPGVRHAKTAGGGKIKKRFAGVQRVTLIANADALREAGFLEEDQRGWEPEEDFPIPEDTGGAGEDGMPF